jgi:predicted ATPase
LPSEFKEFALINNQNQTAKVIRCILTNCKVYQFHDFSAESFIRQSSRIEFADYLQSERNNLASFLYGLKKNYPVNYNKIVSCIRQIIPQFIPYIQLHEFEALVFFGLEHLLID